MEGKEGGMMGGMREMGGGAASPVYPSLMAVPQLSPQRRQQLERQAAELLARGTAMTNEAFARLTAAAAAGDHAGVERANAQVREALAPLESAHALRRVLDEGRAPRDVALEWFRREMDLVPLAAAPAHGLFGLSWFHYIVMFILAAFALAMIAMHFHRMRRAESLLARLAGAAAGMAAPAAPPPAPPAPAQPPVNAEIAPSKPNSWSGLLRVARVFDETSTVKTFRLVDPSNGKLPFNYLPGQFLTVVVTIDGQPVRRSYSISSSPTERDYCEITVKREERGAVSRFLHERVHEGDTLQITAPSGRFTFTGEESKGVVLIGGGVGVTPMMSAVRYLTKRSWPHYICFVLAVRRPEDIIFREELEYLGRRHPNLHVVIVVEEDDASAGRYVKGRITRQVLESLHDIGTRHVHVCGPPPMMNAVKAILAEMGVPAGQVRTETFQGKEQPRPRLDTLPAAQAKVAVVTFAKSNRTAMLPPTKTVLEASEDVGVDIAYSCRIGICGACRVKLVSGAVTMEVQDGLEPGDKERSIILACQAKSAADLSVDA